MRATQLTHLGTDQSPMMIVHSAKIRTKWNSATTAKIRPATRENVFLSMANQLNRWRASTPIAYAVGGILCDIWDHEQHNDVALPLLTGLPEYRPFASVNVDCCPCDGKASTVTTMAAMMMARMVDRPPLMN